MTIRIINAGLPRTGTTSLKGALEILGYNKIFHTTDLFTSPRDMTVWEAAMEGEPVDWRTFFAEYDVADWPAAFIYKELIADHPDAKVMLTVRDPEAWFESVTGQLQTLQRMRLPIPHFRRVKRFVTIHGINGLFGGKVDDKEHMIAMFHRHTETVKAHVGEENLLVYDVREGWEPLCDFLECEVPSLDFPRLNTQGGFREMLTRLMKNVGR